MGYYINPDPPHTKEAWILDHGREISDIEAATIPHRSKFEITLCWINNGLFTALGVCYSDRERDAFTEGFLNFTDLRPHKFYRVPLSAALPYLPPDLGGTLDE